MPAVRIDEDTHRILKEIAEREQQTMSEILAKAVEVYRRRRFLEEANAAYATLRQNPEAWRQELEEREEWDATLSDGLGEE